MTVNETTRESLRGSLVDYMRGDIRTFAFDDANSECMKSEDTGLNRISNWLYQIHDDTVDHPISVSRSTWESLRRIVAFLTTRESPAIDATLPFWPFSSRADWMDNENAVNAFELPEYDVHKHHFKIHGPLNRIPTVVGVIIIISIVVISFGFIVWLG